MYSKESALKKSYSLKIGILVDSQIVNNLDYIFIKSVINHKSVSKVSIIIQNIDIKKSSRIYRIINNIFKFGPLNYLSIFTLNIIEKLEKIRLSKLVFCNSLNNVSLDELIEDRINLSPVISKSGFVFRYSEVELEKIKGKFDVILRLGSGILKGEILSVAKYGVISFHHGDNRFNRGGPPGFWEVYNREPTTGFIIQRLTEELDGGLVVMRGSFPTKSYWLHNRVSIVHNSLNYIDQVLDRIANNNTLEPFLPSQPYSQPLFKRPSLFVQLIYLRDQVKSYLGKKIVFNFFRKTPAWTVGFIRSDWKNAVFHRAEYISPEPGMFIADPFLILHEGQNYCFVEEYVYAEKKARISLYIISPAGYERVGVVLNEKFHLSFPFVFNYDGCFYMIPETSSTQSIRLYRAVNFPFEWEYVQDILTGVSAADTMLLENNQVFYLFTNIDNTGSEEHSSELYIYYADSPLATKWSSHRSNPVIVGAEYARNGGLLFDNNSFVFRMSQEYGFGVYGQSLNANKMLTLNEQSYVEQTEFKIMPNFVADAKGIHHISSVNNLTVFDVYR